jgi:hypothetical protein
LKKRKNFEYSKWGERKLMSVNRIFASTGNYPSILGFNHGVPFRKLDTEGGLYTDTPERAYLYNGDLTYFDNEIGKIDELWYTNLATKRIKKFKKTESDV